MMIRIVAGEHDDRRPQRRNRPEFVRDIPESPPQLKSMRQATIPESIMLRCIANCLETSQYYASKGNRPLAD
jgi:hypothetical protein